MGNQRRERTVQVALTFDLSEEDMANKARAAGRLDQEAG